MNIIMVRIICCLCAALLLPQCRQEPPTSPQQQHDTSPPSPANPDTSINGGQLPRAFELNQPYPNPFNESLAMTFAIPRKSAVVIVVQNPVGDVLAVLIAAELEAG